MNSLKKLVIFGFVLFYLAEIQVGIQAMKNTNKDEDKIQDAQQSRPLPTFEDRPPPSEEKKSSKKPSPLPLRQNAQYTLPIVAIREARPNIEN
uniref:Uncharacterized protein n=1 Tax=Meloidogyne enterolobii TaxID=390850 RepID=A0A6V7VHN3_MELEN|nr:unnamed protein product [Meloidogyne enterolobii]